MCCSPFHNCTVPGGKCTNIWSGCLYIHHPCLSSIIWAAYLMLIVYEMLPFCSAILSWLQCVNFIQINIWDVITRPCTNFKCSLTKLPLKTAQGWVITSEKILCDLTTHSCHDHCEIFVPEAHDTIPLNVEGLCSLNGFQSSTKLLEISQFTIKLFKILQLLVNNSSDEQYIKFQNESLSI